ncbi:unnamed protein product, partial [Sphacelaria rigidula]
ESDGGVFFVESGSSAQFMVPMAFDHNSVSAGYSGGAVYAGGKVSFDHSVVFKENQALSDGDYDAGNGGAIAIGEDGEVVFHDFSYFQGNIANSGGDGGAMANLGSVVFGRESYFESNAAFENGDGLGAQGGAIFTGEVSTTMFERRTSMHLNEASSGGALYNLGVTTLGSAGFIRGNRAKGNDRADGGHIYTNGMLYFVGRVNLREGGANRDGAGIYIDDKGSVTAGDDVNFIDNLAVRNMS